MIYHHDHSCGVIFDPRLKVSAEHEAWIRTMIVVSQIIGHKIFLSPSKCKNGPGLSGINAI